VTRFELTKKYWFHFLSLISIVVFMMWGFSPVLSVFWATLCRAGQLPAIDTALIPYDVFRAAGPSCGNCGSPT